MRNYLVGGAGELAIARMADHSRCSKKTKVKMRGNFLSEFVIFRRKHVRTLRAFWTLLHLALVKESWEEEEEEVEEKNKKTVFFDLLFFFFWN